MLHVTSHSLNQTQTECTLPEQKQLLYRPCNRTAHHLERRLS